MKISHPQLAPLRTRGWLSRLLVTGVLTLWAESLLASSCQGTNLLDAMPAEEKAQLEATVAETPWHQGTLWRAAKGDATMTLIGTLHFDDPRHQQSLDRLAEALDDAAALYVEAGPREMAQLVTAMMTGTILYIDEGTPTLPERLTPDEWKALASAMDERGFSPEDTAELRPWFVILMLGTPPCMIDGGMGLDGLLIEKAQQEKLPIHALESWKTVLTFFSDLTPRQELEMIRTSLLAANHADDYAVTLIDAYFAGSSWLIWEFLRMEEYRNGQFTPDEVEKQFSLMQNTLIDRRNQQWIDPLTTGAEAAAAEGKGIVAGFGALHLPGEQGVLNLLEQDGWTIEPLDPTPAMP